MKVTIPAPTDASGTELQNTDSSTAPAVIVFDAGPGNSFTVSGFTFVDGIFITDDEDAATLVHNFNTQTKQNWKEEIFNPANPRHISQTGKLIGTAITGIMDAVAGLPVTSSAGLAAAIAAAATANFAE